MNRLIAFFLLLIVVSCKQGKNYNDYNEGEFYEVQGIIISAERTSDPTDGTNLKNIEYEYFLTDSIPLKGSEKNIRQTGLFKGAPVVVLVHKSDRNINFYGYNGTLDSLSYGEIKYIKEYVGKVIESDK